jgi:hypothetical protein
MKNLWVLVLSLALVSSAGAMRFATEETSSWKPGPRRGERLGIDPRLMEKATQAGDRGITPLAKWLAGNTASGKNLRIVELNAIGRTLITDLIEAPDRINRFVRTDTGVNIVIESPRMGVVVVFGEGKFLGFTWSKTPPSAPSPFRSLMENSEGFGDKINGHETKAMADILLETVFKSLQRKNVYLEGVDGRKYVQVEALDTGMAARGRLSLDGKGYDDAILVRLFPKEGKQILADGTVEPWPIRWEGAGENAGLWRRVINKVQDLKDGVVKRLRPEAPPSGTSGRLHTPKMLGTGSKTPAYSARYSRESLRPLPSFSEGMEGIVRQYGLTMEEFYRFLPERAETLTVKQRARIIAIRESVPMLTVDTLLEKAIPQKEIQKYIVQLDPKIRGYVSRAQDVKARTYNDAYGSLRLDFDPVPGKPPRFDWQNDASYGVIRFTSRDTNLIKIPFSRAMGGQEVGGYPFTGNGFTGAENGRVIPEFVIDKSPSVLPRHGAELLEVYRDGREVLRAIYDRGSRRFVPVGN